MILVDTHAHMTAPEFSSDLDQVLQRAEAAGVVGILCVAEDPHDSRAVLDLAARWPVLRPAVGLHPDRAAKAEAGVLLDQAKAVAELARAERARLVAIGEVGLDHWRAREPEERDAQAEALRMFAALSLELDLPLSVHSRSAGRRTIELLLEAKAERVVMHGFDGRAAHALRGVDAGFIFAVAPSVVRSRQKQKLVARLPLESLVLETDSPVLGPEPGERNEPANVLVAAREVARIKQIDLEQVAEVTTANALRLFGPGLVRGTG